ncbi:MAG: Na+/H+ antiporter NhaA, partial [Erythrobacter sp.]|nr:Na+/H+ antiporter NhaA [Erythrobacter sp.]
GLAQLPDGVGWTKIYGLSLLAGIGFTMSLFIGNLAFAEPAMIDAVKLGVLSGSLIAAVAGFAILKAMLPDAPPAPDQPADPSSNTAQAG